MGNVGLDFFADVRRNRKSFFLMVNVHDPHRPFYGASRELEFAQASRRPWVAPSRTYTPDEVHVPGFLPDLPEVRTELAQYYSSVRRSDDTVAAVLDALRTSSFESNTLVMLLSDNGMSFPFAKADCYRHSTRTPWIVRWPGVVSAGTVDQDHFISAVRPDADLARGHRNQISDEDGRALVRIVVKGAKARGSGLRLHSISSHSR